mgnify:CR=1 FL=1
MFDLIPKQRSPAPPGSNIFHYFLLRLLSGTSILSDGTSLRYTPTTDAESVTYTYDSKNLLATVTTESTTYSFAYDVFGNVTGVDADDVSIVSYEYNDHNGKLNTVTYSNGFSVEYVYNDIELLKEVWYTDSANVRTLAYEYEYTSSGQVHEFVDNVSNRSTVYKYDTSGRMVAFREYENDDFYHDYSADISYNDKGQLSGIAYDANYTCGTSIGSAAFSYSYQYNTDDSLKSTTIRTSNTVGGETFYYDDFGRLTQKVSHLYVSSNSAYKFRNQIDYTYKNYSSYTSDWVETYTSTVNNGTALTYTFTYDQNGNITKIVYSTGEETRYVYDDLGQLLREDNPFKNQTFVYTYDDAGNILSQKTYALTAEGQTPSNPTKTNTYTYGNSSWGDQLTSYNGTTITYDAIGNPLTYGNGYKNYTFTWAGKDLTSLTTGGVTYSFTYNDQGFRTSKTKNGITTKYYYDSSRLIAEETQGNTTIYLYDSQGVPLGMRYHGASYAEDAWDIYWYETNLLGDVVGIYDQTGKKLIGYTYDAWGLRTTTQYNGAAWSVVTKNSLGYRGYYYDSELGFYCLGTRYYDQNTHRFISPDRIDVITATPGALTDKNLYAYCDNNPVMRADYDGEFWNIVIGAAVGAGIGVLTSVLTQLTEDSESWRNGEFWLDVAVSAGLGAASGGLAASGVGLVGQIAVNAVIGAVGGIADTAIHDDGTATFATYAVNAIGGGVVGAISGLFGGAGTASKHVSNSFWRMVASGADDLTYYFSQVGTQAVRDGIKAIPGILRSYIPQATEAFLSLCDKYGVY